MADEKTVKKMAQIKPDYKKKKIEGDSSIRFKRENYYKRKTEIYRQETVGKNYPVIGLKSR